MMAEGHASPGTLSHRPRSSARGLLLCGLLAAGLVDCKCAAEVNESLLLAEPSLETPPSPTNQVALTLHGTRSTGSAVWIHFAHSETAALLVDAGSSQQWQATLGSGDAAALREGTNTFVLFAIDGDRTSVRAGPYEIVLDTNAPDPVTIDDDVTGAVYLAGATQADVDVMGTKEAGATLTINGAELADATAASSFSTTLTAALGATTYVFAQRDAAGNSSASVELVLVGSQVQPPTIAPVRSPTALTPQLVTGTKLAGTTLHWVEAAADTVIEPDTAATTWSHSLALVEGNNRFKVYTEETGGDTSGPVSGNIVYDVTPPAAPASVLVDGGAAPAVTGETSLTVTGVLPADGTLCIRVDPAGRCTQVGTTAGGAFSYDIELEDGDNYICISAIDAAGNAGDEVCFLVNKIPGPTLTLLSPEEGGLVTGTSLVVSVMAEPDPEADPIDAAVASVQACVTPPGSSAVATCQTATAHASVADRFDTTFDMTGRTDGTYSLVIRADNAAGARSQLTTTFVFSSGVPGLLLTAPGVSRDVSMVMDTGGALHFVWSDECMSVAAECPFEAGGTSAPDIFYVQHDGAWGEVKIVSATAAQGDSLSTDPALAIDSDGTLHVVWVEAGDVGGSGASDTDILHRTISAGGDTLGPIAVIGSQGSADAADAAPELAADGDGGVHLTWQRGTGASAQIYYAKWNDGVWSTPQLVSELVTNDGESTAAAVAVDPVTNAAYVVWQDCITCPALGTDNEAALSCTCRALDAPTTTSSEVVPCSTGADCGLGKCCNSTDVSSGRCAVIGTCFRAADAEVYLRKIGDAAASIRKVSDNALDGDSREPTMVFDSDGLGWIFWTDSMVLGGAKGLVNVYGRTYDGASFGAVVLVSKGNVSGGRAEGVAASATNDDGGGVAAAWVQATDRTDADIFTAKRAGSSEVLQTPSATATVNTGGLASGLSLVLTDNVMHFAWHDDQTGSADVLDIEVYYLPATSPPSP